MSYKRLGSMTVLLMFLVFPVSASMVSLLLVETGINERISTGQYSSLWEGGLMSAFFDAGHVVTNNPVARMQRKPDSCLSGPVERDFREAVNGGADYFVLAFLEFRVQGARAIPVGVELKIYDSNSRSLIYEHTLPAGRGRNLSEEYQHAQSAGRILTSHLKDR